MLVPELVPEEKAKAQETLEEQKTSDQTALSLLESGARRPHE